MSPRAYRRFRICSGASSVLAGGAAADWVTSQTNRSRIANPPIDRSAIQHPIHPMCHLNTNTMSSAARAVTCGAGGSVNTSGAIGPEAYRQWRETTLGAVTEALEHRLVLELAGDMAGTRLLDLGCGDGLLTCTFAERGARDVGIDADRRMLGAAAARAKQARVQAHFVEGRVERLPFPDATFDVVVAVTVFCFLTDAATAAKEAVRVLRPGGRLVLGELGRWSAWAAFRRVRGVAWFADMESSAFFYGGRIVRAPSDRRHLRPSAPWIRVLPAHRTGGQSHGAS